MKAILLAAGKSKRLGRICRSVPKVLLEVAGKPILEHNLLSLKRQGVRQVIINTCYQAAKIMDFLKKRKNFGLKIKILHEKIILGTAGGVSNARHFLKGGPFAILYGDNLQDFNLKKMGSFHRKNHGLMTLGVFDPLQTTHTGILAGRVVYGRRNRIRKFEEKRNGVSVPGNFKINAGVMIASPALFRWIPKNVYCDFAKDLYPVLLRKRQTLQGYEGASYVLASDTPRTLRQSRSLAKKYLIKKGAS